MTHHKQTLKQGTHLSLSDYGRLNPNHFEGTSAYTDFYGLPHFSCVFIKRKNPNGVFIVLLAFHGFFRRLLWNRLSAYQKGT